VSGSNREGGAGSAGGREERDRFSRSPDAAIKEAVVASEPLAPQPPTDAKERAIEHGAEEYYRDAGDAADPNRVQRIDEETRVSGQPDRPDA
jgi:hypothetical protein